MVDEIVRVLAVGSREVAKARIMPKFKITTVVMVISMHKWPVPNTTNPKKYLVIHSVTNVSLLANYMLF